MTSRVFVTLLNVQFEIAHWNEWILEGGKKPRPHILCLLLHEVVFQKIWQKQYLAKFKWKHFFFAFKSHKTWRANENATTILKKEHSVSTTARGENPALIAHHQLEETQTIQNCVLLKFLPSAFILFKTAMETRLL